MDSEDLDLLRRDEVWKYIFGKYRFGSYKTLAKLATVGGGPLFRKVGHIVVYERAELDRWALSKIGEPQASTTKKVT